MGRERGFDFEGGHVLTAYLEHVVRSSGIYVVAVLIEIVFVAAAGPGALEGLLGALAIVPVHDGAGRSGNIQIADRTGRRLFALVVDDLDAIARHRFAAGSIADVVRTVGDVNMRHFGRSDAIQNVVAESLVPSPSQCRRQRFSRRHAQAQSQLLPAGRVFRREQRRIQGRDAVIHRRPMLNQAPVHRLRRGSFRHHDDRRARGQRKRQRGAQSVSEEQLGCGEGDVRLRKPEYPAPVQLPCQHEMRVKMDRSLRKSRRSGGVEPEAHVVDRCSDRLECFCRAAHQVGKPEMAMAALPGNDHVLQIGTA